MTVSHATATDSRLQALVVDDEPLARRIVVDLLARRDDVTVVGECRDGESAARAIERLAPDLLFLDVCMPGLDGFAALANARCAARPAVVFVTAHDDFAVRAFETEAIDYVVKPFTDARFFATVDRAVARLTRHDTQDAANRYLSRILATSGRRGVSVPVQSIARISADDYCARLHTDDHTYVVRQSLASLEQRLDPAVFMRVHRSDIVSIAHVREVRRDADGRYVVLLHDGTRVSIGERRVADVLRRLGKLAP